MKVQLFNSDDFLRTEWSGGKSTELFIYPESSKYNKRNFLFRLSTATVEIEETDFTRLAGISRKLMVLAGNLILNHQGHHRSELTKFDVDEFTGDWKTHSIGKCRDFNLMMTGKTNGKLEAIVLAKNQEIDLDIDEKSSFLCIYLSVGNLKIEPANKVLEEGDLLVLSNLTNQIIKINSLEYCELIMCKIDL